MATSALSYQALIGNDLNEQSLNKIQDSLEQIPRKITTYYRQRFIDDKSPNFYLNKFNFQLWGKDDKLLLSSTNVAETPVFSQIDVLVIKL